MTIEQILGSTNPAEELKNRFLSKSLKLRVASIFSNISIRFIEEVQRAAVSIADSSLATNGLTCCCKCDSEESSEESSEKIQFSEEDKVELFKALKEASFNALEIYKKTLDCIFRDDTGKKEEIQQQPKIEIEVTSTPAQEASVQTNKNYFGY